MAKGRAHPKRRAFALRGDDRIWRRLALVLIVLLYAGCNPLKRFAYEGINRDEWQHPDQVIRSLDIRPGDRIADLGAGGGYFTWRLATAVGPTGRVYAVDVEPGMTEYLAKRVRDEGYKNIEVILAEYHDPLLPEAGVDLIFTCNTYHHLEDRVSYFATAQRYLRPNGRVAIIDGNGQGWFQGLFGHWTEKEEIQREMQAAGYVPQKAFAFLAQQHFLVFSPNAP